MNWPMIAAAAISILHGFLYFVVPMLAYIEVNKTGRIRLLSFVVILMIITLPSWWFFSGDCPLTLLEISLRGMGGDHSHLLNHHTTTTFLAAGMTPLQIYHTLIWETGTYLLVLGAGMIAASLVIDAWWQRKRNRIY